jgi:hypothetical protein
MEKLGVHVPDLIELAHECQHVLVDLLDDIHGTLCLWCRCSGWGLVGHSWSDMFYEGRIVVFIGVLRVGASEMSNRHFAIASKEHVHCF